MVICRNENLIKHAAEVALNNLTVRGGRASEGEREEEGDGRRRVSAGRGECLPSSTISTLLLFFLPKLFQSSFLPILSCFISFIPFRPFSFSCLSFLLLPFCYLPLFSPSFPFVLSLSFFLFSTLQLFSSHFL